MSDEYRPKPHRWPSPREFRPDQITILRDAIRRLRALNETQKSVLQRVLQENEDLSERLQTTLDELDHVLTQS